MHTYANDPNKLSRYAAILYPGKTAEKPENWLARAVREEREAKAAAPVQLADASGADYPSISAALRLLAGRRTRRTSRAGGCTQP